MPKDRLDELIRKANKNKAIIDIEDDAVKNDSAGENELKKSFERSQVIGQWIGAIETNLEGIRNYLNNSNDINFQKPETHDKLQSLFKNNTEISHKITHKLKTIDAEVKNVDTRSAEGRIKAIQIQTLNKRFQDVFYKNNSLLEHYKSIQKRILEAQIKAKGISVTDEELEALLDEGADIQIFTENIIAETLEAKRMLQDIEERHEQLLKIERMLVEVRDLFLQIAICVEDQQELLNRIEYQSSIAQEYVQGADLKTARKNKCRNLKCKLYFALALAIVLIIILILIFK